MNFHPSQLILLIVLTGSWLSAEAATETVEDHLQARWYEVEFILFERLPVLDATTDEDLTSTQPRTWPNNLLDLDLSLEDAAAVRERTLASTDPFVGDADPAICFGLNEPVELRLPAESEEVGD